jgi:hypothetical protein
MNSFSKKRELQRLIALKKCLQKSLDQGCYFNSSKGETRRDRFLKLAVIIQHMNAGVSGGGLSGALETERLWVELLKDINAASPKSDFTFNRSHADSDYEYKGIPLSHKTLGCRNKKADLALAWSKNPDGGIERAFESSMVLLSFRPSRPGSRKSFWRYVQTGFYIIPLSLLRSVVREFKPNNKTSTLIKEDYVIILMEQSLSLGLFIPLVLTPDAWTDYELSYWKAAKVFCVPKR